MIAISYPFVLDAFGKNKSTYEEAKIYLDKLVTLLSTQVNQRPMNPEYGTDLGYALFENDQDFATAVRSAITTAVSRWIPAITINSIDISVPNLDGYSNVIITISLPNATSAAITVNSALFGTDGSISRVG